MLALSLTYKPVLLVARVWLTNLCRPVLKVTTSIVLSTKPIITRGSNAVVCMLSHIQLALYLVLKGWHSRLKSFVKLFRIKNQRVPWTIGALAALAAALDVVQTLSFKHGNIIPYADILLVIAPPAVVLLGFIKPTPETAPAPRSEWPIS
jgi:hypothetical protein